MNKKDRWFLAISLVTSVLPFSIMALAMQFLPDVVPSFLELEGMTFSKSRNLVIGVFCLVPISAVVIAGALKSRKVIEKNYYAVTVGACVISLAFLAFVLQQLVAQTSVGILGKFDFVGVISVGVAFILAFLGVPLYDLKPNAVLGFRNSYTMRSVAVWEKVHRHASYTCLIGFTVLAMALSFARGIYALIGLIVGMVVFLLYVLVASRYFFQKLVVEKK